MIFTRSRITGDTDHDIELHCQSIFFAWGRKITYDGKIQVLEPKFEEISEDDTCFCSTVGVAPMPSSKFTPTLGLCQNCNTILYKCSLNATCKLLLDDERKHCKNILEWDELSNETEPVCTSKCKEKITALVKSFGNQTGCCDCGEITDDHKLSDVTDIIRCRQIHKNLDRWCPNTVNTSCRDCEQGCR